jgi:hypothetical protein
MVSPRYPPAPRMRTFGMIESGNEEFWRWKERKEKRKSKKRKRKRKREKRLWTKK